ncbi:hypothetical protein SLE2022_129650 [Rubroshorea leprosula]
MSMANSSNPQVITCKAVVCWGVGEEPKVEEIQVDPPKSSEVRVKMLYASVCHTDVISTRGFPGPFYPRVLGHEGVGVVESVGEGVTEFKEGDFVIPVYVAECQKCENCTSEKTNLCLTYPLDFSCLMLDGTSRMSVRGQRLYQMFCCSTWSEFMVVNVNNALKIDPGLDLAHASVLSCGFSTGFGAAWKEAQVEKGSSVAIFGLGSVGLGAVEGARMLGAAKIIGIDKNPLKKEKGQAFGMTDFINPEESNKPVSKLIKDLTGGMGVSYSFECTGSTPLVNEAIEATKMGIGKTIIIGTGEHPNMQVNFLSLVCGRTLKGSVFGGIKAKTDLPLVVKKCKNKEIKLDGILTHEVQLGDINRAFELLKQLDCVKVLIKI